MYKKILSIITVLLLSTVNFVGCAAEETPIRLSGNIEIILQIGNPVMTVNGTEKEIDPGMGTAPVIINDRTLFPVRAVVEEMGGVVGWNGDTQEVTLSYNNDEIKLTIDSPTAYLNGIEQTLDTAPVVINDRTMLPIRFIAEGFKFDVNWAQDTQTVTITKASQIPEQAVEPSQPQTPAKTGSNSLVVYFSATGNTKTLAENIAALSGSDIYEIIPEIPYTSADLNYNDSNSRANREQNDATARPAISGSIENFEDYDVIILGYPIWWGTMPKIINTFLEGYDFSGKTIMPFCTSGSSGISTSVSAIRNTCPNSVVTAGFRGTSSTTNTQIQNWLNNNGFSDAVFKRMKLTVNGNRIIIKLNNNNTAKDLADMLPVELDFSDYNNTEKIAYLPQSLNTSDTTSGIAPTAGDLTLYVPWGNLALFYKDFRYSADLISIGSVEEGLDYMTELEGKIVAELY